MRFCRQKGVIATDVIPVAEIFDIVSPKKFGQLDV